MKAQPKSSGGSAALSSYKGLLQNLKASKEQSSDSAKAVSTGTSSRPTTTSTSSRPVGSPVTTTSSRPVGSPVTVTSSRPVGSPVTAFPSSSPIGGTMPGIGGGVAPGQQPPGYVPPLGPGAIGGTMPGIGGGVAPGQAAPGTVPGMARPTITPTRSTRRFY